MNKETNTNPFSQIGILNKEKKSKPHNITIKNNNPNEPKMNINMKDNILIEKDVEKVLTNLQMEMCMMVNILTIFQTVLVNFSGRMEINM